MPAMVSFIMIVLLIVVLSHGRLEEYLGVFGAIRGLNLP
jgi:hypothetical protein